MLLKSIVHWMSYAMHTILALQLVHSLIFEIVEIPSQEVKTPKERFPIHFQWGIKCWVNSHMTVSNLL